MPQIRWNRRRSLAVLTALVVAGVAVAAWANWRVKPTESETAPPIASFPLPPFSISRYLNTRAGVQYIGSTACKECHESNHASYRLTAHSRAFSEPNLDLEPPDASFDHPPSGRSYRIYRQGKQLHHEEVMRAEDGTVVARLDYPVRYLVGSGHYSRTYLVEVDGYLQESPISWFGSRKKWDMSPGFEGARHQGFERAVNIECLACHAGRVEPLAGKQNSYRFHEQAIGCENCHGPGSLHRDLQRAHRVPRDEEDLSIVHPGKLSRPLLESICAACHLSGAASVLVRGRTVNDVRPGIPLTDYRIHYRFDRGNEGMTVVGHIEQLRLSACYQKSADLTCTTCHDPHQKKPPPDTVAFYREKCLSCHTSHPCRLSQTERLKQDPRDNCSACHMPRGATDVPHVAFTHHRIGTHQRKPVSPTSGVPDLVPTDDVSHFSDLEQKRNRGLARAEVYLNPTFAEYAEVYRERAREELESVEAAGLHEGETAAVLAELYLAAGDLARAESSAQRALDAKDTSSRSRANALTILATCEISNGNLPGATECLEEVVRIRRTPNDWGMLGMNYLKLQQPRKALDAFNQSLSLRPYSYTTQRMLAEVYTSLGETAKARDHEAKARWLFPRRTE